MHHIKTADGTALYAREWGTGPAIVLIHGWPLDADMWEYQAVPLAEQGFRVITYDRRGFGRSSQPWTGYDYDTLSDDLAMVMETLKVENALLVGFSMGGGEAARYMSRHGGKGVSKVALVSAVTPYLLKTPDNPEGVDQSVFDEILDGLRTDRQHFLAGFGKTFFGAGLLSSPVSSEVLDWTFQLAMLGSPRATIECAKAFSSTDFRQDLAAIKVPTLVIHGDADATVPFANSGERTAKMVQGAQLLVYPGAPHGLQMTEKDRLVNDLAIFARTGAV
jgi:non-heme chloroperoxidase